MVYRSSGYVKPAGTIQHTTEYFLNMMKCAFFKTKHNLSFQMYVVANAVRKSEHIIGFV